MNIRAALILGLLSLVIATPASAGFQQEKNKKTVLNFYDTAFNRHDLDTAAKYLGKNVVQHDPNIDNGPDAIISYYDGYLKKYPSLSVSVYRIIAEADLVVVHANWKLNNKDAGLAVVDIFRVNSGRIVEHYNVIQTATNEGKSGNSMFNGTKGNGASK